MTNPTLINKLKKIYSREDKMKLIFLSVFLFFSMLLEFLGVGLIFPFLKYSFKDDLTVELNFLNNLSSYHIESKDQLMKIFIFIMVLVYIFKFFFLSYLNFRQNKFIYNLNARITTSLFKKYINEGYEKFAKKKVSNLIKNLSIETDHLNLFITSLITIIVECFLSVTLIILLFLVEPFGLLLVGLFFGSISFIYLKLTKNIILSYGLDRRGIDEYSFKHMTESFGAIKEIIINNKQNLITEQYKIARFKLANLNSMNQTFQQFPRYFLEIIAVLGIFTLLFFFTSKGYSNDKIFSVLALFGAAVFKLMPSMNRIISSINQMKYYRSSLDLIYSEFVDYKEYIKVEVVLDEIKSLSIKNLSYSYGDKLILNIIDVVFEKGDIIGVKGSSGSGKSTFVNLISGLLSPNSGEIKIDNINIDHQKFYYTNLLGYLTQDIFIFDESIIYNITLEKTVKKIDKLKLSEVLDISGLSSIYSEKELFKNLGSNGVKISGGQRQRIGIARLLYSNSQILIFDEATSALDSDSELQILKSIFHNSKNKIIIIISHNDDIISMCSKEFKLINSNLISIK